MSTAPMAGTVNINPSGLDMLMNGQAIVATMTGVPTGDLRMSK